MKQYEKCLVQTDAAISFIKSCDPTPAKEGKNDTVERIHEIFMIQHKVATKTLQQNEESKTKKESKTPYTVDVGVSEFALPKPKRTLRKPKKPILYHSYSSDDVRYTVNVEAQTDDVQIKAENSFPSPNKCEEEKKLHIPINEVITEASANEESENGFEQQLSPTNKHALDEDHPMEISIDKTPKSPKVVFNVKRTGIITKETFLKLCQISKTALPILNDPSSNILTPKCSKFIHKEKGNSIGSMIALNKMDSRSSRQSNDTIKEIDILKNENNQKKGCIDELVEENMRLYKELEKAQEELDALKERDLNKSQDKEIKLRVPSGQLNDSSETVFKELEKYEPFLVRQNTIRKVKKAERQKRKPSDAVEPNDFIYDTLLQYGINKKSFLQFRMPLKSLMKSMNAIYNQLIAANKDLLAKPNIVFSVKGKLPKLFYDMLFLKYGNQAFAMNKFKSYIATGIKYQQIPKVHIFNGLMGMSTDIELEDINFYIRAMGYLLKLKSGVTIAYSDTSERQLIPYIRGVEACKQFFISTLNKDLYSEFMKKVEKNKTYDKTKINTSGIIELDVLLLLMIEQYHMMLGKIRHYIYDIFKASDLDGSNTIDFFEFYVIFINIEADSFHYDKCKQIFSNSCEYHFKSNQTPLVTFNQFAAICHSHNLFSESAQNKFLGFLKADEFIKLVAILGNKFDEIFTIFTQRLEELLNHSEYLNNMLNTIKECSAKENNAREAKPVWMMYKFIESISCQLYMDRMVSKIIGDLEILIDNKQPSTMQLLQLKENGGTSFLFEYIAY